MNENACRLDDLSDGCLNEAFQSVDLPIQSEYYSISSFMSIFRRNTNHFSLCNYNIRSFNANFDEFSVFLKALEYDFDLLTLTETRFAGGCGFDIDNYKGWHCMRALGGGGGVSIYCNSSLSSNQLTDLSFIDDSIEVCVVNMKVSNREFIIITIYRPPNGSLDAFMEFLLVILNDTRVKNNEVILTGDLNINLIDYENSNRNVKNFIYHMISLNYLPLITRPTRFPDGNQNGKPSLLDHIWYNRIYNVETGIILCSATDHLPSFVILKDVNLSRNNVVNVSFRDHSEVNLNKFQLQCRDFNWVFPTNSVNDNTKYFIERLRSIYFNCCPLKTKNVSLKRLSKPWISSALFASIKMKSTYFKMLKLNRISLSFYNRYKNILTTTIRKAKRDYYRVAFDERRKDVKSTWKLLNKLILYKKPNEKVSSISADGRVTEDPSEIAELFNEYFSTVATTLESAIPLPNRDPTTNINFNEKSIYFYPVDSADVIKIVRKLKNSYHGLYDVPCKILK